jgi:glycosyltransferase involved in cell wall biosynthesis
VATSVTSANKPVRVDIWHNIVWSKYKGEVFSSLHAINEKDVFDIRFFQIAETDSQRIGLSGIDLQHHRYPFTLLFQGAYNNVGLIKRLSTILRHTYNSDAKLTLLAGYEKPEFWAQLLLLRLKGRRVAVFCDSTIHDNRQKFFRGILKRIFFNSVHGIFCYGQRSKEYVMYYGADPHIVYHRCQAAALPRDYTVERALADRLAMVAKPNAPRYLYVGRLSPEKGLDTLINAFSKLRKRYANATLALVGSGPQQAELEAQVRNLKLGDAVQFFGSKSGAELFQEYSKATCLVLPSRSEPWGLVVNEALSYGCPVIVSKNCGCTPELVIEGKTGFSHVVDDVDGLAQKMIAAPEHFVNTEATARDCITLISSYSPKDAATQIIVGVGNIFSSQGTRHAK